jgi:hypothetical protein
VDGVFIENNDRFPVRPRIRMAFKSPNTPNPLELKEKINWKFSFVDLYEPAGHS